MVTILPAFGSAEVFFCFELDLCSWHAFLTRVLVRELVHNRGCDPPAGQQLLTGGSLKIVVPTSNSLLAWGGGTWVEQF